MRYVVNARPATLAIDPTCVAQWVGGRLVVNGHSALVRRHRGKVLVSFRGRTFTVEPAEARGHGAATSDGAVRAPIPGAIVEVTATVGQAVEPGDRLAVLEAMKTQQILVAPFAGTVTMVGVERGSQVSEGDVIVRVDPA